MAQEPKPEERHYPATGTQQSQGGQQPHPAAGEQPKPGAAPKDIGPDEAVFAIRKAAGSIAEVFDQPNLQPQRVRIG